MSESSVVAIWSLDRKLKIVRAVSVVRRFTHCRRCNDPLWDRECKNVIVSPDGVARYCLMCLHEYDTCLVGSYRQMPDDPLETLALVYFLQGPANGYIECDRHNYHPHVSWSVLKKLGWSLFVPKP